MRKPIVTEIVFSEEGGPVYLPEYNKEPLGVCEGVGMRSSPRRPRETVLVIDTSKQPLFGCLGALARAHLDTEGIESRPNSMIPRPDLLEKAS